MFLADISLLWDYRTQQAILNTAVISGFMNREEYLL
jgi:hypothetical protein